MTDFGIDISHWQKVRDWNAVHGNNISFAVQKLTDGPVVVDDTAAAHLAGARGVGLRVGGYHFARAGVDVGRQVDHFVDRLRAFGLLSPDSVAPALDVEKSGGFTPVTANAFVGAFLPRLRAAAGVRRVLVYSNLSFFTSGLRPGDWADDHVLLWVARFNGDPGNTGLAHPNVALHQHSESGRVPGIDGNVDRDVTVGHRLADLLIGDSIPVPVPSGGTHVVQGGETLSGIAAAHHTTVAVLAALNHIANPDVIHPGQVLQLP